MSSNSVDVRYLSATARVIDPSGTEWRIEFWKNETDTIATTNVVEASGSLKRCDPPEFLVDAIKQIYGVV